jgi:hypothetical protein
MLAGWIFIDSLCPNERTITIVVLSQVMTYSYVKPFYNCMCGTLSYLKRHEGQNNTGLIVRDPNDFA